MGWPYHFVTLSKEERHVRHEILSFYASIAHWTALLPILAVVFGRLAVRLFRRVTSSRTAAPDGQGAYEAVPRSPAVKAQRQSYPGELSARWRRIVWWFGDDVRIAGDTWGQRDQWIIGSAWTAWLLVLCFVGTGTDYIHLARRFGIIATSQMPIQYFLSLKSLNPYAWAFRSSHEVVNRYHRVLGRIIFAFFVLHLTLYFNFFFLKGVFMKRVFSPVPFAGVLAGTALNILNGTSMAQARAMSYRLFFITHLVVAFAVPALLLYHATSSRFYVIEAVGAFIVDLIVRKARTVTAPSSIEAIPGTNLLKVSASLPPFKANLFRARPGSHIYLSIPAAARSSSYPPSKSVAFEFLYNPFTVASVSEGDSDITLVARMRNGPASKFLAHFASSSSSPDPALKIPLAIEGPYGTAANFVHDIGSHANRIILFAGGVGATFALPIYHALLHDHPFAKVQLIWAIRTAGDATWALASSPNGQSVLNDEHVELFLTGDVNVAGDPDETDAAPAPDGAVEMSPMYRDRRRNLYTSQHNRKRPDFDKIIDAAFRHSIDETVAVLVCGPTEMSRDVRAAVRPWVMKGRTVWWHNEHFGL
ncbi:putative metalloreductase AIM14 [Paramyrothecium foliicola]|nr:putative metalloreductase AIM14 [Paramyrothecium foliicola]